MFDTFTQQSTISPLLSIEKLQQNLSGKSIQYVEKDIELFWKERSNDPILKTMEIVEFQVNNVQHGQMKYLNIKCNQVPYKGKLIKILMIFEDDYPELPVRMYVISQKKPFLHVNIYHDTGQICHPLLAKRKTYTKFTSILKKIHELIYNPNFNNPANFILCSLFQQKPYQYARKIRQNVETFESYVNQLDSDSDDD